MHSMLQRIRKVPSSIKSLAFAAMSIWRNGGITACSVVVIDQNQILKGKRALVTGGSSGIGYAIAKRLIDSGAHVVITGRDEISLRISANNMSSENVQILEWDISDISVASHKLMLAAEMCGGSIDILVNNAGILIDESFPNVTEQGWDDVYAVNSKGMFFVTQEISKIWLRDTDRKGVKKIINISSTSGFTPGAYPYRMTKWDVVGMTQGLALNLAEHRIVVNGIAPGRTAGRMLGIDRSNIFDSKVPLRRSALPEEIAELALFLASDLANYIVGQTIICDGGMTLYASR